MSDAKPIRYALIMPVRDEEKFIGPMIESILAQTVPPTKWIIVDDGSSDGTLEILRTYARRAPCLEIVELPRREHRAPGGEGAIAQALHHLNLAEFDFLARFDADLLFEPDYVERILGEFNQDPRLGIAGGGLYVQRNGRLELEIVPEFHVRGALKMYRRECFEQIGGITTRIGWDTIDEVFAWTKNWNTRSFFEYRVIHRRPTGEGIRQTRVYWQRGKAEYYTWSHPLHVLAKTVKLTFELKNPVSPLMYLFAFLVCYAKGEDRLQSPDFVRARRQQQMRRIFSSLTLSKPARTHAGLSPNKS